MSEATVFQSDLKSLPFLHRGKVRDLYAVGDDKLLVVQTDRLSAFDVILPTPIPGKGEVLTTLSLFWFAKLAHVVPNHLTGIDPESVVGGLLSPQPGRAAPQGQYRRRRASLARLLHRHDGRIRPTMPGDHGRLPFVGSGNQFGQPPSRRFDAERLHSPTPVLYRLYKL